jgi:hypothetical protein
MFWISFAIGVFTGFMLGVLLVSLLIISREGERAIPRQEEPSPLIPQRSMGAGQGFLVNPQ